jgi:hypothetical protein
MNNMSRFMGWGMGGFEVSWLGDHEISKLVLVVGTFKC